MNTFHIVKKIDIPASLQTLKEGETVKLKCEDFCSLSSAASAVSRLNKIAGRKEYSITHENNGCTLIISRNRTVT